MGKPFLKHNYIDYFVQVDFLSVALTLILHDVTTMQNIKYKKI